MRKKEKNKAERKLEKAFFCIALTSCFLSMLLAVAAILVPNEWKWPTVILFIFSFVVLCVSTIIYNHFKKDDVPNIRNTNDESD